MSFTSNLSFVRKNPVTTAVISIALISGVIFTTTKTTGTPTVRSELIMQQKSSSGSGIQSDGWGNFWGSGNLVQDGITKQGTGYLILNNGTSSGSSICMRNTAGTQQVITLVNSTVTVRAAVGTECSK